MAHGNWVEAVFAPIVTRAHDQPLEPLVPFEVTQPIRFGPRGAGAELEWKDTSQLELSPGPGGVYFNVPRRFRSPEPRLIPPGEFWWRPPIMLRVLSSPQESAGWPADLARPPAPWSDEMLSVFADQFLERGRSVGQRFLTRDPLVVDMASVPVLSTIHQSQAPITWRRGVVDALTVRPSSSPGWEFGRALALQAVCAPMRELRIQSSRDAVDFAALLRGVIAGGGLPCLETLRLEVLLGVPEISELRALSGFQAAFPALTSFVVVPEGPRPYGTIG